jgi:ribA/ribD-fused uncharacterized protein
MRLDEPITSFREEYAFLSNFYAHPVEYEGMIYPTVEHAFQAAKTLDPVEREKVRSAETPTSAKRLGKRVTLRRGWDTLRFTVMEEVIRLKFADPDLRAKLVATGARELIEGNTWRDTTWGMIRTKDGGWKGRNELGKILMKVRAEVAAAGFAG